MKNLSINLFTHTRNEAYAIVSQINTCVTAPASALNEHITGATTLSNSTVLIRLNDCSKTDAVIALRDTIRIFSAFVTSGCVRAFYKNINAETTVLSLPVTDPEEAQDKIDKNKLKIQIDDLK